MIVGVDPGGTTGIAYGDTPADAVVLQLEWAEAQIWLYRQALRSTPEAPVVFACERYAITVQTIKKARQYEALYVIGGLELCAGLFKYASLTLQTPAEAKALVTDTKLERMDLYERTKGLEHGRDALRHHVFYSVMHDIITPRELL